MDCCQIQAQKVAQVEEDQDQEISANTVSPPTNYMARAVPGESRSMEQRVPVVKINPSSSNVDRTETEDNSMEEADDEESGVEEKIIPTPSPSTSSKSVISSTLVSPRTKSQRRHYYRQRVNLRRHKSYSSKRSNPPRENQISILMKQLRNGKHDTRFQSDRMNELKSEETSIDSQVKKLNPPILMSRDFSEMATRFANDESGAATVDVAATPGTGKTDQEQIDAIHELLDETSNTEGETEGEESQNNKEKEDVVPTKKQRKPRTLKCKIAGCGFETRNKPTLLNHLYKMHNVEKEKGSNKGNKKKVVSKSPGVVDLTSSNESTPQSSPILMAQTQRKRKAKEMLSEVGEDAERLVKARLEAHLSNYKKGGDNVEDARSKEDNIKNARLVEAEVRRENQNLRDLGKKDQEILELKGRELAITADRDNEKRMKEEEKREKERQLEEKKYWQNLCLKMGEELEAERAKSPEQISKEYEEIRKKLEEKTNEAAAWKAVAVQTQAVNTELDIKVKTSEQQLLRNKEKEECKDYKRGNCRRKNCQYLHTTQPVQPAVMMQQQLGMMMPNMNQQQMVPSQAQNRQVMATAMGIQGNQDQQMKGSCFHWEKGFCKKGNSCNFQHIPSLWGTRKRSNSHGSIQGFQQGTGLHLGALSVINENPGGQQAQVLQAPQQQVIQPQQLLPPLQVPTMNHGTIQQTIQQMEEDAKKGNTFKEEMAKAALESMLRTARMTGDSVTAAMLENATTHKN